MNNTKENDLFYTCSLIEYIARLTKNTKKDTVKALGKENITKIYDLAEVYHSDNIDKIANEFILECHINFGSYDLTKYDNIPSYFDIGKVYKRLIIMVNNNEDDYIDTLITVLSSWIIPKIDNYNSNMYYENPEYIYECYLEGKII